MRYVVAMLIVLLVHVAPASGAPLRAGEFGSRDAVLGWINRYRANPDPAHVPAAVHALSQLGALRDPEASGVYVGFLAGVIASHPAKAEALIGKILPLPPEDQWLVVRAIAYSGLPEWKDLMSRFATHMPTRKVMIDRYLAGKLPTLDQVAFETKSPAFLDRLKAHFSKPSARTEMTFDSSPELLDTLWGTYFATGAYGPIARIVGMLPWAKERDSAEKLTIGNMAKYTLAMNAARDAQLLTMLKYAARHEPKKVVAALDEVIEAAETVDTARLRKEALASIEELKRKGPGSKRDVAWWGQVGQGAIALGCIGAAATGQVEFGLPCVVGGAVSSAGLRFLAGQD